MAICCYYCYFFVLEMIGFIRARVESMWTLSQLSCYDFEVTWLINFSAVAWLIWILVQHLPWSYLTYFLSVLISGSDFCLLMFICWMSWCLSSIPRSYRIYYLNLTVSLDLHLNALLPIDSDVLTLFEGKSRAHLTINSDFLFVGIGCRL